LVLDVRQPRFEEYIDFLTQIKAIESVRGSDGEEWLTLKVPLPGMLRNAIEQGFALPPGDEFDLLSWAACTLAIKVLSEREIEYSRDDLLGIASVFRAFMSEVVETDSSGHPQQLTNELRLPGRRIR